MNTALQDNDALVRFRVGPVWCCAPSRPVRTIIVPPTLTRPPGTSAAEPGIFRHGDVLVRVNDLRERFGVRPEDRRPGCLIVVNLGDHHTGFWVDEILDVSDFPGAGWGPLPPLLPRGIFSRTLNFGEHIHLFAEFSRLDGLRNNGYLRTWIASLEKDAAQAAARERDSATHASSATSHPTPPTGPPDTPAVTPASPAEPTKAPPETPDATTPPRSAPPAGPGRTPANAPSEITAAPRSRPGTSHDGTTPLRPEPTSATKAPSGPATSRTEVPRPAPPPPTPTASTAATSARASGPATPATGNTAPARPATMASATPSSTAEPPRADPRPAATPPSATPPPPAPMAATREMDNGGGGLVLITLLGLFGALVGGIYWLTGEHGAPAPTRLTPAPMATPQPGPPPSPPPVPFETASAGSEPLAVVEVPTGSPAESAPGVADTARPEPATTPGAMPGAAPGEPVDDTEAEARPGLGTTVTSTGSTAGLPAEASPRATIERDAGGIIITVTGPLRTPAGAVSPAPAASAPADPEPVPAPGASAEGTAGPNAEGNGSAATPTLPAPSPPTSEMAPAPVPAVREIIHIVVRGDTLWAIAERYVQDPFRYPELARLSNIENPDLIYPGDRVRIRYRPTP
ncbi:MAG TPA: LysM peptidoglycan-binding domain-containing protein [Gammaproteobacteria bacterium]|nr:LysM peptidoglycan-binding domain-containing protein [Gammaproteobacteria bacterium]